MTKFEIFSKDREIRISCKNHAKSDVCRGVSALIFALISKLDYDMDFGFIDKLNVKAQSGDVEISFEYEGSLDDGDFNNSVLGGLATVVLGMKTIKNNYPDELELNFEGCDINFPLVGRN